MTTRKPGKSAPRQNGRVRDGETLATPPSFCGREHDIALIDRLIGRIHEGGAALLISGEPGIGKTALLELVKTRAQACGLRVLSITGVPMETQLPFAALHQALHPIMKRADVLPPRQRSALLAAFGIGADAPAPDMFLVALATLTLLTESAARRPILFVADDAQWLDQPTYDVLSFVSKRLEADPVALLMAMRDDSLRMLGHLGGSRHRLAGLDDAAAAQVLDANAPDLSAELHRRFIREAAGNPLALVELPRSDPARGPGDPIWLPLTDRLERAFFARVSDLPAAARTLLFVAAENDGTSLQEILRAGDVLLGSQQGTAALAPAVAAKLVEIDRSGIRFRHPLVRSAIHQSADLATRQQVHAALATVIRDQPDRQIWHRAAATIGPDEELAVALGNVAARAQQRGGVAAAVAALESAARLSGTQKNRTDRLLWAAELAADLGRQELVERLLREANPVDPDPLTRARIGWIREMSQPPMVNDPAKISALVGLAAQAHDAGANGLAVNLLWRAAQRCWWGNAGSATRADILAAADRLGLPKNDPRLIAIAGYASPLERGGDVYALLTELSATTIADPAATRILGSTANVVGAFDLGVTFLAQSSAALREQGRLGDLARVLFARAWAEMEVGDWMGAMRSAEELARLAEETDGTLWIAAGTIVKATLAGMRGTIEVFEDRAVEAERLVLPAGASFLLAMLQIARGVTAIGAGRHAEAYEYLQRLFTPADPAFNSSLQFFALADFVEAAALCGQKKAAHDVIAEMERLASPTPVPWVHSMLCYGKALLAAPEDAERLFHDGLGPAIKAWPFLRGRLLLAYGGWLRRQRRAADARAPLRAARDIFDALGASPWGDRARQELRASGESSRQRKQHVWDALSPQELHIVQLAADGLTNKEIGARLYLSHRTVGYHLHRIFLKTGIASRSRLRSKNSVDAGNP